MPIFAFASSTYALKEYLLFIDTETSGVPLRWDRPYSDQKNWPSVIQVAWIIYECHGKEIRRVCEYIYDKDITISKASQKIHGLDLAILASRGNRRKDVLRKLAHDINKYNPLIIGHFIELDVQVLSADFFRAQLDNPFIGKNFFCTMLNSEKYAFNPQTKYLRLAQLYAHLFDTTPETLHEAERDAELTATCFFELYNRNELRDEDFQRQQKRFTKNLNIKEKLTV